MGDSKVGLQTDQIRRYQRHLNLPQVGVDGQRKLLDSRVVLIGAGGLGCPTAQYLAAAGVGTLGLIDFDIIEVSNLQRQVLFGTEDVGRPKVEVAAERIRAMNPDIQLELNEVRLTAENALDLLSSYDVVVDGTDNFATRYLVNDACVFLEKPNVHGSIFRFEGQATLFYSPDGPCYRCLYREPPPPELAPSCAEGGVLGVLPGLVAMIQATETIKFLLGIGSSLAGRLVQYDALTMSFSEFRIPKDPECPVCGTSPSITELKEIEVVCASQVAAEIPEQSAVETQALLEAGGPCLLLDVREPHESQIARIEAAVLIPLGEVEKRLAEISEWKERPIVVHCQKGARSAKACVILRENGFKNVVNMAGGIDAWSREVDPQIPRY